MKRLIVTVAAVLALAGCSSTLQDLEGVHAVQPDLIQAYYNVDLHPNVVVACPNGPEGFGYATTTRDHDSLHVFDQCPIQSERGEQVDMGSGGLE